MFKKILLITVLICLVFSICASAENTISVTNETVPGASQQMPQGDRGNMRVPPNGEMPVRGTPPNMPNGEMPAGGMNRNQTSPSNVPPTQNQNPTNSAPQQVPSDDSLPAENSQTPNGNQQFGGRMPGGMGGFPGNIQNFGERNQEEVPAGFRGFVKTYSTPIISLILLGLAFIFVIFYKRKNY